MPLPDFKRVTCRTSVNIAVIKYWGKSDETLILPINDSISGTLDSDDLCTTTTAAVSSSFKDDRMWLNGSEVHIRENVRLTHCLNAIRSRIPSLKGGLRISSHNNFPTAAGLASSAAGYAALIYALGNLFGITNKEELSVMARMGSGSAIRSLDGGFVHWIKGKRYCCHLIFTASILTPCHLYLIFLTQETRVKPRLPNKS